MVTVLDRIMLSMQEDMDDETVSTCSSMSDIVRRTVVEVK